MRKLLPYLNPVTLLLVGVGAFIVPQVTQAAIPDAILSFMGWGTDVIYGFLGKLLWWAAVPVTGLVVQLVGSMIDLIISISADRGFYNSDAIKNSWAILRDVGNMTFIFILIFNGLQVILNRGNLATIKKVLGGVILAAVFINFSLFFTKAVIDVSNITAAWFIQGIYGVAGTTSVSDAIHGTFQMSKLAESPTNQLTSANFSSQAFATGVIMVVLNCIVIYVFFQLLFILLGRFVTFIVLLITAPIGFVGLLLPQLKDYAEKWWKELNSQAMLAPMVFLMLYIVLYLVDQTNEMFFTKGGGTETDAFTGSSFSSGNYVMFAIIIALLLKVLDVAKEYSGELGGKIGGVLKSATMVALGGAAGAGSLAGRFVGKTGVAYLDGKGTARERLTSGIKTGFKGVAPTTGLSLSSLKPKNVLAGIKDKAKGGTWDVRNAVPNGDEFKKGIEGIMTGKTGVSFGQLDAKGLKDRDKKWKEEDKKRKEEITLEETEVSLLEDIRNLEGDRTELAEAQRLHTAAPTTATQTRLDDAKKSLQAREDNISKSLYNTSNKDLEKLNADILTNPDVLNLMSADEMSHLRDKSELSEKVKNKIREVRETPVKKALDEVEVAKGTGNAATIKAATEKAGKALGKLGKKEIETLSSDILNHPEIAALASPDALSPDALEAIFKSDAIVPGVKKKLKDARYQPLRDKIAPSAAAPVPTVAQIIANPSLLDGAKVELDKFKEGEISKIETSILQDPRVALLLSTQTLSKILESGDMSQTDRSIIKDIINEAYTQPGRPTGNSEKLGDWLNYDSRGRNF